MHTNTHTQIPVQMRCSDIQTQPTNQHALRRSHNGASQWGSKGRWEISESKCPTPHPCLTNFHSLTHSHTFHSLLPCLPVSGWIFRWLKAIGHSSLPKHSCMNHLIVGWVRFLTLLCPPRIRLYFDNHTQLQCEEFFVLFFVATVGHKLKGWFTVRLETIY